MSSAVCFENPQEVISNPASSRPASTPPDPTACGEDDRQRRPPPGDDWDPRTGPAAPPEEDAHRGAELPHRLPDPRRLEDLRRLGEERALSTGEDHRLVGVWNGRVHDRAVPVPLHDFAQALERLAPVNAAALLARQRPAGEAIEGGPQALHVAGA
eukprot:CAMPEP_0171155878 /NCGR_PEP_ID=MMETSP0790-20130122/1142_1 /TAXON_ID=2925 /ORGANISM="Alexandrium catenella, Strain OF101" /LENGTH=155 /DNA_ID=CAMNT_0011620141 /DNA_START=35 /DNA_END=502 /DNA_ORIENTATION=+